MIAIGIPLRGEYIHIKFWESSRGLIFKEPVKIIAKARYGVEQARNWIVKEALKSECSHLLFLDSDMTFPPDILERLRKHNKKIIGASYYTRKEPHVLTAKIEQKDHSLKPISDLPGLWEIDAIGMGATLIDMEVFRKMDAEMEAGMEQTHPDIERPWFKFHNETYHDVKTICTYAEDDWFCMKAKKLGYKVFADTSVKCGHITTKIIGGEKHE